MRVFMEKLQTNSGYTRECCIFLSTEVEKMRITAIFSHISFPQLELLFVAKHPLCKPFYKKLKVETRPNLTEI